MVAATVLAGGLLVPGCGSGDGAASSTSASDDGEPGRGDTTTPTEPADSGAAEAAGGDACDIVSDEVAAEVLGVEVVRREASGEQGAPSVSCIKGSERSDDPADFSYVSVSVTADGAVLVDGAGAEADSVVVDGVGDQAVYLPSAGALFVADGTDAVQVQVILAGVPGTQEDVLAVATDVFDHRG